MGSASATCSIEALIPLAERREQPLGFGRKFFPFGLRNPMQSDGSRENVLRQPFRPQNLAEPSRPLAPQPIELEQPILRHGVAEAEKQIRIRFGEDVRHTLMVAADFDWSIDGRYLDSRGVRHARFGRALPALEEFGPGDSNCPADGINRFAAAELGEGAL